VSLLKRLGKEKIEDVVNPSSNSTTVSRNRFREPELEENLLKYLIEELKKHPAVDSENLSQLVRKLSEGFLEKEGDRLTFESKKQLIALATDELIGYGPISSLLKDPFISEVMVNGPNDIYVEKKGQLVKVDTCFKDNDHVMKMIERIITPLGRRVDESSPMVDARLPDGSRVNVIIPPLALNGPCISIRKFSEKPFLVQDLIRFGTLSQQMANFIEGCVKARLNIFISGGTGSGKTTSLNVLSSFIPSNERIVTIEDAAELKLFQDHIVSLETRPPNIEGKGAITIRDLVRNSLRMRPDRLVIGEVRSAEALDMLQAMNTGHDGSLATGHANTPRDMLSRLETMVLMAGMDLPIRAIREQIAGAIDIIIHQSRLRDGTRKITHVTEVLGIEGETIVLQDLFVFQQSGITPNGEVSGEFTSTGIRPHCGDKLEQAGIHLPAEWFRQTW
jgi:pilus assembly protein CpaF